MNTDKLFVEVMQEMQDLTRLFEKALVVERKLDADFKALTKERVPRAFVVALEIQGEKLHDTFIRLEEAMNE